MQEEWNSSKRPNFLMGGMNTPYKPSDGPTTNYTKEGAAALRLGRTNEQAAADLRSMLYKDGEGASTSSAVSLRQEEHSLCIDPSPRKMCCFAVSFQLSTQW